MKKSLVKYPFLTKEVEIYERDNGHKIVLAHKEGDMVNVSSWVKTGIKLYLHTKKVEWLIFRLG